MDDVTQCNKVIALFAKIQLVQVTLAILILIGDAESCGILARHRSDLRKIDHRDTGCLVRLRKRNRPRRGAGRHVEDVLDSPPSASGKARRVPDRRFDHQLAVIAEVFGT